MKHYSCKSYNILSLPLLINMTFFLKKLKTLLTLHTLSCLKVHSQATILRFMYLVNTPEPNLVFRSLKSRLAGSNKLILQRTGNILGFVHSLCHKIIASAAAMRKQSQAMWKPRNVAVF